MHNGVNFQRRDRILTRMASRLPLTHTLGADGLAAWLRGQPDRGIVLKSRTARSVAFYLGPARRYFGEAEDTLTHGRGRAALIISRRAICKSWEFSPFDLGELLYHWREGRLPGEFSGLAVLREGKDQEVYNCSRLEADFRQFLDRGYEKPQHYLDSWRPPRPDIAFGVIRNAIYRAASDRWFGRVRPFAPAWTFEVRAGREASISLKHIIALVIVSDPIAKAKVPHLDRFRKLLGPRVSYIDLPEKPWHPDLTPLLLESETTRIIRKRIERGISR